MVTINRLTVFSLLLIIVFSLSITQKVFALNRIVVAATKRSISNYYQFTEGKNPLEIDRFTSKYATRQVVDMIIIQKALKLAGYPNLEIIFKEVPNSARERATIKAGIAVIGENEHWADDFDDSVYMTLAIISHGEFEKGIYTLPQNSNVLKSSSLKDIQQYTGVMIGTWREDWKTMQKMNLKKMISVPKAENIFRMIKAGRGDFSLFEFSSEPDFSRALEGIKLVPVYGIKVGLNGSRHFMVSKLHPDGKSVYEALQKGLKELKAKHMIKRFYTECGFYDLRVENWKKIN